MRQLTLNFQNDTEPSGGMRTLSLPEGSRSRASRSASPVREKAREMTAISGRRCLELFGRFVPDGSWAKTFPELFIGQTDWFSSRCVLTWKMRATKSKFVLPACGVNAPHKRNRIWFVAHRADSGSEDMCQREDGLHAFGVYPHAYGIGLREWANEPESVEGRVRAADISACSANGDASDTDSQRREERFTPAESGQKRWRNGENGYAERRIPGWSGFPTQSPICRRDDGFPGGLDGITFPAWRRESVKAYGNAIVPQVALRIFETINDYEKLRRL